MIPASFDYSAPKSLDEAIALLGKLGDEGKILAGGHSLVPALKLRLASSGHLVDLSRIEELSFIREDKGAVAIGAMTTHHAVLASSLLKERCPLLPETAACVGDVQVRNRGTVGGSLAHADPGADSPAAILALEAEMVAASAGGKRTIAAKDFFVDMLTTALRPDEVLTEVRVPAMPAKTGVTYLKLRQPASGFAIVGVAAVVTLDGAGKVGRVRIGVTGAASKAFRSEKAEAALAGQSPTAEAIRKAAGASGDGVDMSGDIFASSDYRKHLVKVFTLRALTSAVERAGGRA